MNPLTREEVPGIRPAIIEFDDMNDTIVYLDDMIDGAEKHTVDIANNDKFDYLGRAAKLLRKEKLTAFVRGCGAVCISGVIDINSPIYDELRRYAVLDQSDTEVEEQLDTVIRRFANHIDSFEVLYSRKRTPKKAPETTTAVKPGRPPKIPQPIDLIVEEEDPRIAQLEALQEYNRSVQFAVGLLSFIKNLISKSADSLIFASDIDRRIENNFGISREAARIAINNYLKTSDLFRAGARGGKVQLSDHPVEKQTKQTVRPQLAAGNLEVEQFDDYDKRLAGEILDSIVSVGHQNKGKTRAKICLEIGLSDEECFPLAARLIDKGILVREVRWERSKSANSRKKQSMFLMFASQEVWEMYKKEPAKVLAQL